MSSHPNDQQVPPIDPSTLPSGTAINFVAYGAPEPMATPDGETVPGRPQVYVRWFDGIKIAKITDGGRNGSDTVGIEFDAQSVGFTNAFSAYMNPSDPTLPLLRDAFAAGAEIQIALESVRKVKAKKSEEPISKQTPIHALRGAQHDGSQGSMDASGQNIRNIVALVDGHPTETLTSDPSEWKYLAKNRSGELAPQGWRAVFDKDDWTKTGFIILNAPQGSADLNDSTINAIVTGVVEALSDQMGANGSINGSDVAREVRRGVFTEGKPWNPRTSNGMVNLGGYLLAKNRAVFMKAIAVTGDAVEAQELTQRILAVTDRVQEEAYGHGIKADRLANSHKEAGHWVDYVIDSVHVGGEGPAPYPMYALADGATAERRTADRDAWCSMIAENAAALFKNSAQLASDYLQMVSKRGAQVEPRVEGTSQREALRGTDAPSDDNTTTVNPRDEAVRSLAQAIQNVWGNPRELTTIQQQLVQRQMDRAQVALQVTEDGSVSVRAVVDVQGQDGWKTGSAMDLLEYRLSTFGAPNTEGSAQTALPPASEAAGAQPDEKVQPSDATATTSAPATEYSAGMQEMVERLRSATPDLLQQIYADARDRNLLDERVAVYPNADGTLSYGSKGQTGFVEQPLSAVLERLSEKAQAASQPDQEIPPADAPSDAPEATSASTPAPAPEENVETDPTAQGYADRASEMLDQGRASEIEELIAEVKRKGLGAQQIVVGEMEGDLMAYLYHLKEVADQKAPAGASV